MWTGLTICSDSNLDRALPNAIVYFGQKIMGVSKRNTGAFRMPAEWEPHEATWLAWPHNYRDWPGKTSAIKWVYIEIIRLLYQHEKVHIIVEDKNQEASVRSKLRMANIDFCNVNFFHFTTDRSWVRDSGPTFITDETKLSAVCWKFNAWARYKNWKYDYWLNQKIARASDATVRKVSWRGVSVVLEGGSIDVNGLGTLLTTEECLLGRDQPRNLGVTRKDYERIFFEQLGIQKVLWLRGGIVGDDTGGHIDSVARFVGPSTILVSTDKNQEDINHQILKSNLERLQVSTDQDGRHFQVVELPMPRPLFFDGCRLPASYANFYIANGVVLVPTFNDPNDRIALSIIERLFPEREVCGIHSVDFVWGLGTIHCVTQQQPITPKK